MIPEYSGKTWQQSMKGSGDAVLAHTQKGVTVVMVAAVEEYRPQEHTERFRTVIRKKGTGNRA